MDAARKRQLDRLEEELGRPNPDLLAAAEMYEQAHELDHETGRVEWRTIRSRLKCYPCPRNNPPPMRPE